MRRDLTNQSGYFCPTENKAIKNTNSITDELAEIEAIQKEQKRRSTVYKSLPSRERGLKYLQTIRYPCCI